MHSGQRRCLAREISRASFLVAFVAFQAVTFAQTREGEDFDQYSVRVSGFWLYSSPTVSLEAAGHNGFIRFNKDFNFREYSTFLGKLDWKLTRKNHLYLASAPFTQSNHAVLNRTITFRGQTYVVGASAEAKLQAIVYAPGFQYDI